MRCELQEQFKQSRKGYPPWSTKAFVRTVCEIEHHDIVFSGVLADEFSDERSPEWIRGASHAVEEATEEYMIEVLTITHPLLSNMTTDW
jgi:hypothetical protein